MCNSNSNSGNLCGNYVDFNHRGSNNTVCAKTRTTPSQFSCRGSGGTLQLQKFGRNQMKVMKLALLGTAALAAVSVSARADDLSALKAQIEALQADVAALQAAPSVPAGYSLMTVSEGDRIVVPGLEVRDSNARCARLSPPSAFCRRLTFRPRRSFSGRAASALLSPMMTTTINWSVNTGRGLRQRPRRSCSADDTNSPDQAVVVST